MNLKKTPANKRFIPLKINFSKKIILLFFFIPFFFFSFQSFSQIELAKDMGEWTTPKWQTSENIKQVAKDSAVYDALYYVDNFRDWVFLAQHDLVNFPGIYLFDKNLSPIKVFLGSNCPTKATRYIDNIESSKSIESDSSLISLKDFLSHTKFIDGQKEFLNSENKNYDYIFVYTWVTFIPKKAKEVYNTAQELMKKKDLKFKIIGINEDFMAKWGENPAELEGKKVDIENLNKYNLKY